MNLIFRPIFIVFFVILALSLSFSLTKRLTQHQSSDDVLSQIQKKNTELLLQEKDLAYQVEQLDDPFITERLLRDQKWLQKEGESHLTLIGYQYEPRAVTYPTTISTQVTKQWSNLLTGNFVLEEN